MSNLNRTLLVSSVLLLLSACSHHLVKEPNRITVMTINATQTEQCLFLGSTESKGDSRNGAINLAINILKNRYQTIDSVEIVRAYKVENVYHATANGYQCQ
ncbi:hypothetical protein L0B53_08865 [Vibrio sp. SS-MA-C1-2]|uniref:hypothetical protein n=1 Tax=Vibrio sp. SS-MA-C1-2 TaxID=2908646 RepID=UPI001F315C27|nr:hypothetical protein [Vibrio sp. SS-MA-C1-2]UJF19601.1 hypothetical protein L0B53_08865 [Vibrio sp. SS-MA-C1-2]